MFCNAFSEPSNNIDLYEDKAVELIGWGAEDRFGPIRDTLKRISLSVFPMRQVNPQIYRSLVKIILVLEQPPKQVNRFIETCDFHYKV